MTEEKPLPCAFCGREPREDIEGTKNMYCATPTCTPTLRTYSMHLYDWNVTQRIILDMRRNDFEAGWEEGRDESNIFTIFADARFDEYIKGQHEEEPTK